MWSDIYPDDQVGTCQYPLPEHNSTRISVKYYSPGGRGFFAQQGLKLRLSLLYQYLKRNPFTYQSHYPQNYKH